ncbi:MAG TPA: hypothetical protein VGY54_03810, partial [Polyangiaceae bacterium]|nr:hypothetical protein [Polyangiaceae bacterium]
PLQAPLVHVMLADSYTQFWASLAHVASVVEFAQAFPMALHTGSVLHAHAAAPAAPMQLWCAPHATGEP